MSEFRIFIRFFLDALKAFPKNPTAIVFGAFLTVGSFGYISSLFEKGAPLEQYQPNIVSILTEHPLLLLAVPIILAISTFAKGGLIAALSEKPPSRKTAARKSIVLFPKLYGLEVLFLLVIFVVLIALLIPAILTQNTPPLRLNLALLGLAIFLPVFIVLTFVEIYAFFHIILSKTSLRASIELGYALFMKRAAASILFGATSILILIIVSLITGIIFGIGNALIPDSPKRVIVTILILFLLQSAYTVIQKNAWLSFFRFIGIEKPTTELASQKEEDVVQKEVPEIG